ncbi:NACHT domain-containing protein [Herbidospora sp. NBRC 101105]|uniref:NACHT domain-containing protein n=1 Tax=Herbidospora sp. NBRC 101105 TaxID=3032195 RepID=UPI0024A35EBB|nr:NACHT domain-containing protein [Herbidospora sp. NBRC 101105]GLX93705.1 hypothetical protein Hesp01_16550 [Herbidospora sp. NBRC 101105]
MWLAIVALLVAGAVGVTWPAIQQGQWDGIDPGGVLGIALGLAATVIASRQVVRAQRIIDVDYWARWLADHVGRAEARELRHLLGYDGQTDLADRSIDVEFVLQPTSGHQATGAGRSGRLTEVVDYYRKLKPRRLAITGAPGAGKTVLAVRLIVGLLADPAPGDRVPVRLPAAECDAEGSLPTWLISHLVTAFSMPRRVATALVEAGRVLPVIDGLDEVDLDTGGLPHATRVLHELNSHADIAGKTDVVLTCRTEQFAALNQPQSGIQAQDFATVQIIPVVASSALSFLETRVGTGDLPRWGEVFDTLDFHPDAPLTRALANPWRLTLALTVYQQRDPATRAFVREPVELTDPGYDSPQKIRDRLLADYIGASVAIAGANGRNVSRYSAEQVHAWLGTLAGYLNGNRRKQLFNGRKLPSTEIVLHELWPLAGDRPRLLTNTLAGASSFMILLAVLLSIHAPSRLMLSLVGALALTRVTSVTWPDPWRVSLPRPRTHLGHRRLAAGALFGLAGGTLIGLATGLTRGFIPGIVAVAAFTPLFALYLWLLIPGDGASLSPGDPLRKDVVAGLAFVFLPCLPFTLAYVLVGFENSLFWLLWPLFWFGLIQASRRASTRYLALIMCTRGRLPWRLSRFLRWCYRDAGILRVAGISYQFRHRELQDFLAPTHVKRSS